MRVNKLVNKIVSENSEEKEGDGLDAHGLCKIHKKNIKFVEKNVEAMRVEVEEKLKKVKESEKEMTMKLKEI